MDDCRRVFSARGVAKALVLSLLVVPPCPPNRRIPFIIRTSERYHYFSETPMLSKRSPFRPGSALQNASDLTVPNRDSSTPY